MYGIVEICPLYKKKEKGMKIGNGREEGKGQFLEFYLQTILNLLKTESVKTKKNFLNKIQYTASILCLFTEMY